MKRRMKCAVIGAGNMGKNHIRVYSAIAQLVAIADPIEGIGRPLAEEHGAAYYSDYKEMLDREQPDAVSVVVPTRLHKEITVECLKRKIPTLVEKPMADNTAHAQEMLDAARKHKTLLMVGHIERFNPAVRQLKKLITEGRLGKIISLNSIRVGISPPPSSNSDVVLDLAIHDIDVFNFLLDEFPRDTQILKSKIYERNISDSAAILLNYPTSKGLIQTNWITPIKKRILYITGTTGFAELDYINQKLVVYEKNSTGKANDSFSAFVNLSRNPTKQVYVSKKEPLKEELRYFLHSISSKRYTDSSYALEALKVALTP